MKVYANNWDSKKPEFLTDVRTGKTLGRLMPIQPDSRQQPRSLAHKLVDARVHVDFTVDSNGVCRDVRS